jgi:penicillin-binding protein 1A
VSHVKPLLEGNLGAARLYNDGLTVRTTLHFGLQQAAEEALARGLDHLAQRMRRAGIDTAPQGALVALEVSSGAILAMVGGRDFGASKFNRAVDARRQPGSAFKPVVYACAVENGISQNALLLDAPVTYPGLPGGRTWQPKNFSRTYAGEVTLRNALARSRNIPAVRLTEQLTPEAVVRFAHRLGIASPLKPTLALGLGAYETTLLELTAAYSVFPAGGVAVRPHGLHQVLDRRQQVVWRSRPRKRIAMSAAGAAVMVDLLGGVISEGTGRRARKLNAPLGGKTGTTDTYRDALFVGFGPRVAAGVWVGRDDGGSLGPGETGARAALPVWMAWMARASALGPVGRFDTPDGVVTVPIDPLTGQVLAEGDPRAVKALFVKGTEPGAAP